jgi:ABC-2 type transport system permease protein
VPYPDTRGLVEALRKQIPPDLPYRITDMFATIMLYDNKAVSAKVQPTSDCKYKGGDLGGRYEEDARQR